MDGTQHQAAGGGLTDPTAAASATRDPRSRRDFLRAAGLGGLTLVVGGGLAACADGVTGAVGTGGPSLAVVNGNNITLDFSTDVDVLNYAYALEQLEAAFYTQVVANAAFTSIFPANEQRILVDLRDHEVAHREFFAAALGSARIPNLTPDFSSVNFASRASVLQTARTFEDLGVAAYNGAGRFLRNATFLTVAGKIVSVEARHASAIRAILFGNRTQAFADLTTLTALGADPATARDAALPPSAVLAAADPFIVQNITVVNATA